MSVNLQYCFAKINLTTGKCTGCMTTSDYIDNPAYIEVPELRDYVGNYYNRNDGLWYADADFTVLVPELNA